MLAGELGSAGQQSLVPQVNAIELANRDSRRTKVRGKLRNRAEGVHR
jgi:hypothetical protein